MEKIVESERGDVQTLAQDCKTLRREAVSAREECEKAKRLKSQLEALVAQLQEDTGMEKSGLEIFNINISVMLCECHYHVLACKIREFYNLFYSKINGKGQFAPHGQILLFLLFTVHLFCVKDIIYG